jgi:hypothetical protein
MWHEQCLSELPNMKSKLYALTAILILALGLAHTHATIITGPLTGQVTAVEDLETQYGPGPWSGAAPWSVGDALTGSYEYDSASVVGSTAFGGTIQFTLNSETFTLGPGLLLLEPDGVPSAALLAGSDVFVFGSLFTLGPRVYGIFPVDVDGDGDDDTVIASATATGPLVFGGSGPATIPEGGATVVLLLISVTGTAFLRARRVGAAEEW